MISEKRIRKAEKIRASYPLGKNTAYDYLVKADKKVRRPAIIFAIVYSFVCALTVVFGIMLFFHGFGIDKSVCEGIIAFGSVLSVFIYPLYRIILKIRKSRYTFEIIMLSDKVFGETNEK